jgi:hypothetical protein
VILNTRELRRQRLRWWAIVYTSRTSASGHTFSFYPEERERFIPRQGRHVLGGFRKANIRGEFPTHEEATACVREILQAWCDRRNARRKPR